jgi:hypothetical protein
VLHRLGAAALAASLPSLGAACSLSEAELEDRLVRGVAELSGTPTAPEAVAAAVTLPRDEALAKLRGDAADATLWAATSSGVALRAWLARCRTADLREGRVRWVRGWLLTDTEIAAAALAAG